MFDGGHDNGQDVRPVTAVAHLSSRHFFHRSYPEFIARLRFEVFLPTTTRPDEFFRGLPGGKAGEFLFPTEFHRQVAVMHLRGFPFQFHHRRTHRRKLEVIGLGHMHFPLLLTGYAIGIRRSSSSTTGCRKRLLYMDFAVGTCTIRSSRSSSATSSRIGLCSRRRCGCSCFSRLSGGRGGFVHVGPFIGRWYTHGVSIRRRRDRIRRLIRRLSKGIEIRLGLLLSCTLIKWIIRRTSVVVGGGSKLLLLFREAPIGIFACAFFRRGRFSILLLQQLFVVISTFHICRRFVWLRTTATAAGGGGTWLRG